VAVERLGEQRVREVGLELGGARLEHRAAAGGSRRRELAEQPRLADPRLALDRDDATRPPAQRPQRGRDRRALGGTTDERSRRRGGGHGDDSRAGAAGWDR